MQAPCLAAILVQIGSFFRLDILADRFDYDFCAENALLFQDYENTHQYCLRLRHGLIAPHGDCRTALLRNTKMSITPCDTASIAFQFFKWTGRYCTYRIAQYLLPIRTQCRRMEIGTNEHLLLCSFSQLKFIVSTSGSNPVTIAKREIFFERVVFFEQMKVPAFLCFATLMLIRVNR